MHQLSIFVERGVKLMKIQKISSKVELNVSAQGCDNDCTYWATYSAKAYKSAGEYSGCAKVTDARWTTWW